MLKSLQRALIVARPGQCKIVSEKVSIIRNSLKRLGVSINEVGTEVSFKADGASPDLVVTIGGDGTFLHAASIFTNSKPPLYLPISSGTLGFMLPLEVDEGVKAIERLAHGKPVTTLSRSRLSVRHEKGNTICGTALNEVHIHRGSSTGLARMNCMINGTLLTEAISDGLLVSTATGSTAYSLSAGGPMMHPSLQAMLITPICPRSLSFRPILVPSTSSVVLQVAESSRSEMQVSIDGMTPFMLPRGEGIKVEASPYPLQVVCRTEGTKDWVHGINNLLSWNLNFHERLINATD